MSTPFVTTQQEIPYHHALDLGTLGLGDDRRIIVSSRLHGDEAVEAFVGRFHGQPLRGPVPGASPVRPGHVKWHLANVFKKPARAA